ncbi:peptidylprolyl isomerase [Qipengyuania sp. SS22]|uniref:peptidylprolyl isomerase n=1 Tax=Qipengyuania sp. SS22 TaxID=2979461 RepID=UPI0021E5EF5F|nr:peptidylprolyl isomerase [Qipengyuania sp. SS22]UYH54922.1 peptidylprolyl isomerase [Qipengyuania sp. SS22]
MTRSLLPLAALLALGSPVMAQKEAAAPSPGQIVAEAPRDAWVDIAPEDLLVMTLAPATDGSARQVVIQLMPEPFSQGWVENIRTLARAEWYDGITINRVQDNYVVQWGDPNYDNPEAEGEAKPLPEGLRTMPESDYVNSARGAESDEDAIVLWHPKPALSDSYAAIATFSEGWPIGIEIAENTKVVRSFPVHCYGMVGVGRGYSPDTGSGAELYTVIGHAPRHLDRNIALVGRILKGMEHLSSLPRGSGALGFYTAEEAGKRMPIRSVRVASDLPAAQRPAFEYLSTEGETFARYAEARANRRDPFFIHAAGGADICNIPVPVRQMAD